MLKVLLKKQLSEIFRSYFYDQKKNKARSKGTVIAYMVLFVVLIAGVLGGMFAGLSILLCGTMVAAGMDWLYFTMMGLLAVLLGAFGSVFNTYAGLYLAKDNDLLLSMPIPVRTIIAARLLGVYLMGLMYAGVVLLPAIVVYLVVAPFSVGRLLAGVLFFVLISLFVLTLSCTLGFVVAKVSLKLKNKSFITVVLSLLFFGAYYFLYYKAQELLEVFLQNVTAYGERIRGAVYPLYLFGAAATGDPVALPVFAAVVLLLFYLVWRLLSHSFIGIATASGATAKKTYKAVRTERKSADAALLRKELARFTASPNYMLNCGMGILMLPLLGIFLLIKGDVFVEVMEELLPGFPGAAAVLLCAAMGLVAAMNDMAAPSVSLEGKSLWLLQSTPVTPWQVLRAKLSMHLILTLVPTLFCFVCTLFVYPYTVGEGVSAALFLVSFVVLSALFGLFLGLKMVNLNWTSEITPIKQSAPVALALFGDWGYALMVGGLFFLLGRILGAVGYMLCIFALTAVLCALLLSWIRKKGTEIFATL